MIYNRPWCGKIVLPNMKSEGGYFIAEPSHPLNWIWLLYTFFSNSHPLSKNYISTRLPLRGTLNMGLSQEDGSSISQLQTWIGFHSITEILVHEIQALCHASMNLELRQVWIRQFGWPGLHRIRWQIAMAKLKWYSNHFIGQACTSQDRFQIQVWQIRA